METRLRKFFKLNEKMFGGFETIIMFIIWFLLSLFLFVFVKKIYCDLLI